MAEPRGASVTVEYDSDYGHEGACECHLRPCGEDVDCPPCKRVDTYEGCPLQGFGCAWHADQCDCCTPAQRMSASAGCRACGGNVEALLHPCASGGSCTRSCADCGQHYPTPGSADEADR